MAPLRESGRARTLLGETEGRTARLYDALRRAASLGEKCPKNSDLGEMLGISPRHIPPLIGRLVTHKMIVVYWGNSSRIVEITATGQRTAGDPATLKPHWRARGVP